jgi:hypothetical protein
MERVMAMAGNRQRRPTERDTCDSTVAFGSAGNSAVSRDDVGERDTRDTRDTDRSLPPHGDRPRQPGGVSVLRGDLLQLDADRARPVEEGSFLWRGELRLWDNEALMGWYHSTDAAVRSKGTLYLALHPHGTHAWGRWVGMSYDGPVVSGYGAIARTESHVCQVIEDLIRTQP